MASSSRIVSILATGRNREDYLKIDVPLYEASIKSDWKAANAILDKKRALVRKGITKHYDTALHVAASAKGTKQMQKFVKNLVDLMEKEDLELQNINHNTAFYMACAAGNIKAVEIMVDKNRDLPTIAGARGKMLPIYAAALFGHDDVVKYLYDNSSLGDACWTDENQGWLLEQCVESNMFDVAIKILQDYTTKLDSREKVLGILAGKPDAFIESKSNMTWGAINWVFGFICFKSVAFEKESEALKLLRIIWKDIVKQPEDEIDTILKGPADKNRQEELPSSGNVMGGPDAKTTYSSRILFIAAEMGNTKFVVELIRKYPDLIWQLNDDQLSIFHVAVKHRQQSIYSLLYEIGAMKDMITPHTDVNENNMLHLLGKITNKTRLDQVSGAALQMQRVLLWFEEVHSMIPRQYRQSKNKDGLTPHELFTKEHIDLVTLGEKWMKGTANQCMVVAALIATIMFAAAFTVPGGYDQNSGIPMFISKATFMVFVVADAISFFSSSASILIFLSILTSRYAERDFLELLPKKLLYGLATLFLSILTMTVTFSVSFFVLYHRGLLWMPILTGAFAVIPTGLYIYLQFSLFYDVIRSTYGSKHLFKPTKRVLYYENPKV